MLAVVKDQETGAAITLPLKSLVPLTVADLAFGSGHFNLAQGIVGTATGIGASLSTVVAGYVSDLFGSTVAFLSLAAVAALGLGVIALLMPETRRTNGSTVCS